MDYLFQMEEVQGEGIFFPRHLREKCILFVKLHLHREKVLKDFFIHSPTEFDRLRYATFIPSLFSAWASWSKLQIWLFCSLPAFAASNFCSNLLIFAWSNWPYKNILLHSAPWPSKKDDKITATQGKIPILPSCMQKHSTVWTRQSGFVVLCTHEWKVEIDGIWPFWGHF